MGTTILYHTWEPGLEDNYETSGGGAMWTKYLFKKLQENGFSIVYLKPNEEFDYSHIDMAIFCWRWLLPNLPQYAERNALYDRQNKLIEWCIRHKIPFLVHDQDLKMTFEEQDWVRSNGGHIATPSLFPEHGEIQLHYPNPYLFGEIPSRQVDQLVYVGNNYERMEQAVRFFNDFSFHCHTVVFGNWMETGPGRDPKLIRTLFPWVAFGGRLPQTRVIDVLSKSRATVLLHKPEYGYRGFVTIRWAEAASAGCLPFIPVEFALSGKYIHSLSGLRVSGGSQMLQRYNSIDNEERIQLINEFREFVQRTMKWEKWAETIERIIHGYRFYA